MTIEIVKGEDNPVAEFFSSTTDTPETDAVCKGSDIVKQVMTSRRLERERDEARNTVERLTDHGLDLLDENRSLRRERNKTLKLGNKLADECERILGLGLHQNTLPRFKAALEAWRENN